VDLSRVSEREAGELLHECCGVDRQAAASVGSKRTTDFVEETMLRAPRSASIVLASAIFGMSGLLAASPAHAVYVQSDQYTTLDDQESTGPGIILDLLLVRPLGVVATVLGTTCFVIGLPIIAITHDIPKANHYLIAEPARFTFVRPLGDLSNETEY
jgi:hypothetical protein